MSVSFVTSKLKTQSLAGEEDDEAKRSAQDPTPSADERDHDENDPPPHVIVEASQTSSTQLIMRGDGGNLSVGVGGGGGHFVPPHDEDYSSEEELKEIISCRKRQKKQQRARSKPYSSNAITPSRNSMSSRSSSAAGGKAVLGCSNSGNGSGAKRKLSTDGYYYLCDSSSDVSSTTPKARPASSSLRRCRSSLSAPSYKSFSRPASGVTSRAQSVALSALHSSEAADADVQSRNLDTPVQFCTSPPVNVHRPKRQANKMAPPPSTAFMFGRSPPTKMFHFQPLEPVGRQQTEPQEDEDDPEVSAATAASSVLEAHDDVDSNGETPDAATGGGVAGSEETGQENVADGRGVGGGRPSAIAKPVRKSQSQTGLHHLLGASSSTPRRSTQVKVTRAGRRRQRPSLDFEKMQQIKKKVVTSWRPQGGELSLFCW